MRLPCLATTATPNIGKITAVAISPSIAKGVWVPACIPSIGGKMRLPAPKNIEKSIKPITMLCFRVNFFKDILRYSPFKSILFLQESRLHITLFFICVQYDMQYFNNNVSLRLYFIMFPPHNVIMCL